MSSATVCSGMAPTAAANVIASWVEAPEAMAKSNSCCTISACLAIATSNETPDEANAPKYSSAATRAASRSLPARASANRTCAAAASATGSVSPA